MRYGFMARHRAVWPTDLMCRVLRVSRSGFYAWSNRAPSAREREDQRLLGLIRTSFEQSDATYGSPRVWDDLRDLGGTLRLQTSGPTDARASPVRACEASASAPW